MIYKYKIRECIKRCVSLHEKSNMGELINRNRIWQLLFLKFALIDIPIERFMSSRCYHFYLKIGCLGTASMEDI